MRPLVPVLVSFLLGIIAGERLGPPPVAVYPLLGLALLVVLIFYLRGFSFSYLIAAPPFFFLGALFIMANLSPELPPNHIRNIIKAAALAQGRSPVPQRLGNLDIEAEVKSLPVFTGPAPANMKKTRLVVEAKRAFINGRWERTTGDVLITVKGRVAPLAPGDRVRAMARFKEPANFGNPGEFDYKRSLNLKGIYVTGFVKDKRLLARVKGAPTGLNTRLQRRVYKMRYAVGSFIESSGALNKEALKALTIGERSGLDPALRQAFTDSGTAHVLAISGLHMGMAALLSYAVVLFLLKRSTFLLLAFNVKKIAAVISLVPVVSYGLLAGLPVSAERSVVMVLAYVFTVVINRGRDLYNVLALAAFAILVVKPHSIWEVSFQLTFAAVFSIIYLTPRLHGVLGGVARERHSVPGGHSMPGGHSLTGGLGPSWASWLGVVARRWFKGWLLPAFLVTLAATLGTYPVLAYHFNRVSVVGLVANLVVVPLTGVVVPFLLGASWALSVSETLARVLLFPADLILSLIVAAARFFSSLPHASVRVSTPTIVEIILFYLFPGRC